MSTLWLPVQEVLSRHTVDNRKRPRIAAGPSLSQQTRSGMIRAQKSNGGETNWASNFWTRTTHSSADASLETVVSAFSLCTIPGVSEAITGVERLLKPRGKYIFFEQGSRLSLPSSAGKGGPAAVPPAKNEHCGRLITLWESGSPAIAHVRDRRCSLVDS